MTEMIVESNKVVNYKRIKAMTYNHLVKVLVEYSIMVYGFFAVWNIKESLLYSSEKVGEGDNSIQDNKRNTR